MNPAQTAAETHRQPFHRVVIRLNRVPTPALQAGDFASRTFSARPRRRVQLSRNPAQRESPALLATFVSETARGKKGAFDEFVQRLLSSAHGKLLDEGRCRKQPEFPNNDFQTRQKRCRAEDFGTMETLSRILYRKIDRTKFSFARRTTTAPKARIPRPQPLFGAASRDITELMKTRRIELHPQKRRTLSVGCARHHSTSISTTGPVVFRNLVLNQMLVRPQRGPAGVNKTQRAGQRLLEIRISQAGLDPAAASLKEEPEAETEEGPLKEELAPMYISNNI